MKKNTGYELEQRVHDLIQSIADTGFVDDVKRNVEVVDSNGIERKIDLLVVFRTHLFTTRVIIEAKSRRSSITLDDVNQIRLFKLDIRDYNLFWLIYEGTLTSRVRKVLKQNGISAFSIAEFEEKINTVKAEYEKARKQIEESRRFEMWIAGHMCSTHDGLRKLSLHSLEQHCMKPVAPLFQYFDGIAREFERGQKRWLADLERRR